MISQPPIAFDNAFGRSNVVRRELISLGDVFALVAPLLQAIAIPIGGVLLVSDLALVAALPLALIRHPERLKQKPISTVLKLGVFWLVAQIVTDLVRSSDPADYYRGWSKIFFVLLNFTVVWLVVGVSRRRFVLYGVGLAVGTILSALLHPSDDAISSPWKFGLGIPISILVAILAAQLGRYRLLGILLPLGSLAALHIYMDFRIMAVICFLIPLYTIFLASAKQDQLTRLRRAMLVLIVASGTGAFSLLYSHYALEGVFGKYAQQKLEAQSSGEGGSLLGGRREILASGQAILDSPVLGHGSWARDSKYVAILRERSEELGYKRFQDSKVDDLIPSHSFIFGSWVDAGIAGGIFWLFVLCYSAYAIFNASGKEPLLPFFAFAGLMLMWDILFSPLGSTTRFSAPFFMVAVILLRRFQTGESEPGWAL
jgi:hypothetical protein